MGQGFLTGSNTNEYEKVFTSDNSISNKESKIVSRFKKEVKVTINNYPLCKVNNTCPDDETTGEELIEKNKTTPSLVSRTLSITFETLYQNLASLPNNVDMSNRKYIVREYYLEEDKTVVVVVDMLTTGVVLTTISGDTGFDVDLTKHITFTKTKITTVYDTKERT